MEIGDNFCYSMTSQVSAVFFFWKMVKIDKFRNPVTFQNKEKINDILGILNFQWVFWLVFWLVKKLKKSVKIYKTKHLWASWLPPTDAYNSIKFQVKQLSINSSKFNQLTEGLAYDLNLFESTLFNYRWGISQRRKNSFHFLCWGQFR